MSGWIGVDLDGTLAQYGGFIGMEHIGAPVPAMLARVKKWVSEGRDVRIFTARVDGGEVALLQGEKFAAQFQNVQEVVDVIQDWCEKHVGKRLPVTNKKDFGMVELYDDRCVQVEFNTGRLLGTSTKGLA